MTTDSIVRMGIFTKAAYVMIYFVYSWLVTACPAQPTVIAKYHFAKY